MLDAVLEPALAAPHPTPATRPALGFLGVGWIGRSRLEAIAHQGAATVACVADPLPENTTEALRAAPAASVVASLPALLAQPGLAGVVIATPSALHAEQSLQALAAGTAVFCQKPLGRTAAETRAVVAAARQANLLLGVDLSYRHTAAMQRVREVVQSGELGQVYAVELVFHNAYGPDKPWFYDPSQSGGGCVIDLGVHLVDLALWSLGFPAVQQVRSSLFAQGQPLADPTTQVEDYATASLTLGGGTHVQLSCSWNLPVGQEASISATFYGTQGGVAFRNVNGSFYDFVADRYYGTRTERLAAGPDAWPGRAAAAWAQRLAQGEAFAPEADEFVRVAEVLDRIYGR